MNIDVGHVLEHGVPPLPSTLGNSEDVPIARCFGERHAAVLAAWYQEDGDVHNFDCIVLARDEGGSLTEVFETGGPWPDPLSRPEGSDVAWNSVEVWDTSFPAYGGIFEPFERDESPADYDLRLVLGIAPTGVAAIEAEHADRRWTVPTDSPSGAFIVLVEATGPATVRGIDHEGRPIAGTERDV